MWQHRSNLISTVSRDNYRRRYLFTIIGHLLRLPPTSGSPKEWLRKQIHISREWLSFDQEPMVIFRCRGCVCVIFKQGAAYNLSAIYWLAPVSNCEYQELISHPRNFVSFYENEPPTVSSRAGRLGINGRLYYYPTPFCRRDCLLWMK